MFADIIKVFIL